MFKNAWNQSAAQARSIARGHKREIAKIDGQIATLLDRIVEASSPPVVAASEKRIVQLERDKLGWLKRAKAAGARPAPSMNCSKFQEISST